MTKKQYQKIVSDFRIYYNKEMSPALQILERKRKRLAGYFFFSIILFAVLIYLIFAAHIPALTLFALIPITIYTVFVYYRVQNFKAEFKPIVVQLILDFIDKEIEAGNNRRLQEIEQNMQAYNLRIKELQYEVSQTKQKLYYKIEQRIEDISKNIDGGVEHEVIDVVKKRVDLLEVELNDLRNKIAHAKAKPDNNSEQRIEDMEAEHLIVERKLKAIKLSLEEGLEEQIEQAEFEIGQLKRRNKIFRKRMGERLKASLQYNFNQKISKSTFMESGIFNINPDVYKGEDYIKGYIGTATFEMSELHVQRFSPVRSILENIFQGIFFKANFYYDASGGLVVFIPKEERQELSETIRGITSQGGSQISVDSPEFDELFVAYASADVDADSLLSKEALASILDYKKRSGKKIYVSFIDGYVYIAITETKDILEPKILKSNADYKLIREFFEDLLLIISIVEDFDLNH
jgi:hypothetical protein